MINDQAVTLTMKMEIIIIIIIGSSKNKRHILAFRYSKNVNICISKCVYLYICTFIHNNNHQHKGKKDIGKCKCHGFYSQCINLLIYPCLILIIIIKLHIVHTPTNTYTLAYKQDLSFMILKRLSFRLQQLLLLLQIKLLFII